MARAHIPVGIRCQLWAKAGGRCEYPGCNKPLWKDLLTQDEYNNAYLAHIIAEAPDGPRGHPVLSEQLAADPINLMLLCDSHHRLIDRDDVAGHTVEILTAMKQTHEQRIELQTELGPELRSEIICYQANIGPQPAPMHYRQCAEALRPHRYPASPHGIGLGVGNSAITDRTSTYWAFEPNNLRTQFKERVAPRLAHMSHVSVFALAPQPLLMLLGHLLSDLPDVDVFQRRREPQTWAWPDKPQEEAFIVKAPTSGTVPALALGVTFTVDEARIRSVLPDAAIWHLTVANPHHDFVQSRLQLRDFRQHARKLLDQIKAAHPAQKLHIFPILPASLAVEFGRVIQPKAHLPMQVYDEQQGFVPACELP